MLPWHFDVVARVFRVDFSMLLCSYKDVAGVMRANETVISRFGSYKKRKNYRKNVNMQEKRRKPVILQK